LQTISGVICTTYLYCPLLSGAYRRGRLLTSPAPLHGSTHCCAITHLDEGRLLSCPAFIFRHPRYCHFYRWIFTRICTFHRRMFLVGCTEQIYRFVVFVVHAQLLLFFEHECKSW